MRLHAARDWPRLSVLLDELLDLPEEQQAAALARLHGDDVRLRAELAALLEAERAPGLLATTVGDRCLELLGLREAAPCEGEAPGTRIGPYRILAELGRGGMGTVFLAERADGQFEQRVALKLIKPGLDSEQVRLRFLAERQILARLQHPHVARLLDGGQGEDGRSYLVMEYVEGTPLVSYCEQQGLPAAARLELLRAVCQAVHYAHRNLVVHRDLKPSNILVTREGQVKLLDFGIAKLLDQENGALTELGQRVMTPEYAAPEQVRGEAVTTATDVYALGLLVRETLSGQPPRLAGHARLPDADLESVAAMALREEPEQRYASAEALGEDLGRFLRNEPVLARRDGLAYRARKFVRRNRLGVGLATVGLLGLLGGLLAALWQSHEARREAQRAQAVRDFVVGVFEVSDPDKAKGEKLTARELLDRGAERIERELSGQPEQAGELLGLVSELYGRLGLYERSASLSAREIELQRRRGDEAALADGLVRLGNARELLGELEAAEAALRAGLELHRRRSGEHGVKTVQAANGLAYVLVQRGRYDEAQALLERALDGLQAAGQGQSEAASDTLVVLTTLLGTKGERAAAEGPARRALEIRLRLLGERHTKIPEALGNLGTLALGRGDLAEAEALFRRASAIEAGLLGDDHPDLVVTLNNLASAVQEQGKSAEAETLRRRALALAERHLGAENPQLAVYLVNLAGLLGERGQPREALPLLRRAVGMNRRLGGDEHVSQANTLAVLGTVLAQSGQWREAESAFLRSRELYQRLGLEKHKSYPQLLEGYGRLLTKLERPAEARPLLSQALALRRERLGDRHRRTLSAHAALQECLARLGQKNPS